MAQGYLTLHLPGSGLMQIFIYNPLQECLWKNEDFFIVCLRTGHEIRVLEQIGPAHHDFFFDPFGRLSPV